MFIYLRKCSTCTLHDFTGSGLYKNNPTTGTIRFLDKSGKVVSTTEAKHGPRWINGGIVKVDVY